MSSDEVLRTINKIFSSLDRRIIDMEFHLTTKEIIKVRNCSMNSLSSVIQAQGDLYLMIKTREEMSTMYGASIKDVWRYVNPNFIVFIKVTS